MKMITKAVDDNATHVTVTDDDTSYEYSISLARENVTPEDCLLDIYRQMYQGADIRPQGDETKLEAWKRWISEGHTNPEISEDYQVEISPAVYALTPNDPVKPDLRVGERRVDDDIEVVGEDFREIERRVTKPEILEPAKFETKTRIIRPEQKIEKVEWVSTHPKKLAAIEALKAATTIAGIKAALLEIL